MGLYLLIPINLCWSVAAVGVSGGPDSMALCVLAVAWKKAAARKAGDEEGPVASAFVEGLLGVVVDHGLRPESADEARLVRDRVRGLGNYHILNLVEFTV